MQVSRDLSVYQNLCFNIKKMSKNLVLPDTALKGNEHEKWKAMVDSVIEFISASRTMLEVLNERIIGSEKLREKHEKQMEEEKIKLEFYNEFLNSGLKSEVESKTGLINPSKEGQGIEEIKVDKEDDKRSVSASGIRILPNNSILSRQGKKFTSKIPRTKSCVDERNKSYGFERTHNEGRNIEKFHKSRKASEPGYTKIHQRSKTPKGDISHRS